MGQVDGYFGIGLWPLPHGGSEMSAQAVGYIEWCRRHFNSLNEEGVWLLPRSGLLFQKRGDSLYLIERKPGFSDAEQESELIANMHHFGLAGINVYDETR